MGKRSMKYAQAEEKEDKGNKIMGIPINILILATIIAFGGGAFVYFTYTTTQVTPEDEEDKFTKEIEENTYERVQIVENATDELVLNISQSTSEVVVILLEGLYGSVDDIMNATIVGVSEISGEQWGRNLIFKFKVTDVWNVTDNIDSAIGQHLGDYRIYNGYFGSFVSGGAMSGIGEIYVLSGQKLKTGDIFAVDAGNLFRKRKDDQDMGIVAVDGHKIQSGDIGIDAVVVDTSDSSVTGKIKSNFNLDSLKSKLEFNTSISHTPPKILVNSALEPEDVVMLNNLDGVSAAVTGEGSTTINLNIENITENESESYINSTKQLIRKVVGGEGSLSSEPFTGTNKSVLKLDRAVDPAIKNNLSTLNDVESVEVINGKTEIIFNTSDADIRAILGSRDYGIINGSLSFTLPEDADADSVRKLLEDAGVSDIEIKKNGFVSLHNYIMLSGIIASLKQLGQDNEHYPAILGHDTKIGDKIKVELGASIQTATMPDGSIMEKKIVGLSAAVEMSKEEIEAAAEEEKLKEEIKKEESVEETGKMKIATIKTNKGTIKFKLYTGKAPKTTENFIKLANDGFYSGLVFHRVIPGFMIQGGGFYADGTQKESPYGTINLEIHPDLVHDDGAVAMARTDDPNSATSQFYICDGPQHGLDRQYAVFGMVIEGMDIVKSIASVETATRQQYHENWPVEDVIIEKVTIEEVGV